MEAVVEPPKPQIVTNYTIPVLERNITYPIKFTYVNRVDSWWPPENLMSGIGMPGFAFDTIYEYFALAFGLMKNLKTWSNFGMILSNIAVIPVSLEGPRTKFNIQ